MSIKCTRVDHQRTVACVGKVVFSMTVFVGVDIAKHVHVASILSQDGEVLLEPFSFENTSEGFLSLIHLLDVYPSQVVTLGYESTAHYAANFKAFFLKRGYSLKVFNPVNIAALRRSESRNTKTDKLDSLRIAEALLLHRDCADVYETEMDDLLQLCRSHAAIQTMCTRSKIQLVTFVDQLFPELPRFFKGNLHIKTAYQLLKRYPLPDQIVKVRLDTLTHLLKTASHGRYARTKALELKALAKRSVGIHSTPLALQIHLALDQIELYTRQLDELSKSIHQRIEAVNSPILTIPGLGSLQAAVILASIKTINRFDHPKQVVAFAGLDPIVRQSGHFRAKSTRMSKRGSPLLRYHLMLAAFNVVNHEPTFNAYYQKKRLEGKSHYSALGHTAVKLIRVIFHLLKSNIPYTQQ